MYQQKGINEIHMVNWYNVCITKLAYSEDIIMNQQKGINEIHMVNWYNMCTNQASLQWRYNYEPTKRNKWNSHGKLI